MTDRTHQHRLSFRFAIDGVYLDGASLQVLVLHEALSEAYQAQLILESRKEIDRETRLGKPAFVEIADKLGGTSRYFHGCLTRIEGQRSRTGTYHQRITLEPRLGILRRGQDCRVWRPERGKALSVLGIAHHLLTAVGMTQDELLLDGLAEAPPERDWAVQHRESDYAFLTRLLADEGIGFLVDNTEAGDCIAFFDGPKVATPIPGNTVHYRRGHDDRSYAIHEIRHDVALTGERFTVRDYDRANPFEPIEGEFPEEDSTSPFEIYDHRARAASPDQAKRLARTLAEGHRQETCTFRGMSDCQYLAPGKWFTLVGHPRDAMAGDFWIHSVAHRMDTREEELRYSNHFVALPRDIPFRPVREPAPVTGVQSAIVTGDVAELFSSGSGEVRVRFPWDRSDVNDGSSSTWCPVGQLPLSQSMVMPRVGFEVLVDRAAATVDRTVVTGHLYNAAQPPPYVPSQRSVVSSFQSQTVQQGQGTNEIRIDDTAGAEEIYVHASLDQLCVAGNDSRCDVGHDESVSIAENHTIEIGGHATTKVGENRKLTVGGNHSLSISADLNEGISEEETLTVKQSRELTVHGDLTETVNGTLQRTVQGMMMQMGLVSNARKVIGNATSTVTGFRVDAVGTTFLSNCGMLRTETVGGLKMIKAKTLAIDCGLAYEQTGASMKVQLTGNRADRTDKNLNVTAKGGFSVKAKNINIEAKQELKITIGKTVIEMKPTKITFKSKSASLPGVKKHGSKAKHASGP